MHCQPSTACARSWGQTWKLLNKRLDVWAAVIAAAGAGSTETLSRSAVLPPFSFYTACSRTGEHEQAPCWQAHSNHSPTCTSKLVHTTPLYFRRAALTKWRAENGEQAAKGTWRREGKRVAMQPKCALPMNMALEPSLRLASWLWSAFVGSSLGSCDWLTLTVTCSEYVLLSCVITYLIGYYIAVRPGIAKYSGTHKNLNSPDFDTH